MKRVLLLIIVIFPIISFAAIYMKKDQNGDILYTDTPIENAEEITISDAGQTSPSTSTPDANSTAALETTNEPGSTPPAGVNAENNAPLATEQSDAQPYKVFEMVSPKNQETIQNQPTIVVTFKTDPELKPGDTIQVSIDGKPWGNPVAGTRAEINLLERGEHTLSAQLLGKDRNVLNTIPPITIFVHRASNLFRPARNNIESQTTKFKSIFERILGR
jgi:hypothetical protein